MIDTVVRIRIDRLDVEGSMDHRSAPFYGWYCCACGMHLSYSKTYAEMNLRLHIGRGPNSCKGTHDAG